MFDLDLHVEAHSAMTWPKKLLKYATSCRIPSTAHKVVNGLIPYWPQIIIAMRGCVVRNDLSPSPICLR